MCGVFFSFILLLVECSASDPAWIAIERARLLSTLVTSTNADVIVNELE